MRFVKKIPNFFDINECQIAISCHDDSYYMNHYNLTADSLSSFNFFRDRDRNEFHEQLDEKLNFSNRILEHIKFPGAISHVWLNKQPKNSALTPHTHTHKNCVMSGSLYLKVDSSSSAIKFSHVEKYIVTPELGMLLVFPSWLVHGGHGDNLSDERIVLSFNVVKN
jgi:hypothetical protein